MEILMTIAKKVVDYTVAPVARQVGYLIFYEGNFEDLKDQIQELMSLKDSINYVVETAASDGSEIRGDVKHWLDRVDEIIEAAEQLCDDPRHKHVGCSKWSFPDLWSRYQLSRKAKKMARHIAEVGEGMYEFDTPTNGVLFELSEQERKSLNWLEDTCVNMGFFNPLEGVGSSSDPSDSGKDKK